MRKYYLDTSYTRNGAERRVIIVMDAANDDEAMRAANPVADLALYEGGENIQVVVTGPGARDIGVIIHDMDFDKLEPTTRYGRDYEPSSPSSS